MGVFPGSQAYEGIKIISKQQIGLSAAQPIYLLKLFRFQAISLKFDVPYPKRVFLTERGKCGKDYVRLSVYPADASFPATVLLIFYKNTWN
ncbi:hypothetical protein BD749_1164 [Pontibacter ramchanderi]|uniref:Uncharacterized protein n=1 Tax=Pontibacter ramchanderi TaxID=1179743 RepID=A0A2N3V3K5_9BACT|nr:hypothetical protein BD749_1164 [Pontibacter ramchanderi]